MYLYKPDKEEYRTHLIDPLLPEDKREGELTVEGFEPYVKELVEFVIERVRCVTGAEMEYESSTSEEGEAIATIEIPDYFGGIRLIQAPALTQNLSLVLAQNLVLQVTGCIDIEECSDIEAAYIGAYSVLLHEIGHHFDYNEVSGYTNLVREAHSDELDPDITKEVICDRIALLLGKIVMPCLSSRTKQRLFWISKMGLLHGFLVRIEKDFYDRDQSLLVNLLREKLEFEKASKIKIIGDQTRYCVDIALADINELLQGLQSELSVTDEQLQQILDEMRQAYRAIQQEMLEVSE